MKMNDSWLRRNKVMFESCICRIRIVVCYRLSWDLQTGRLKLYPEFNAVVGPLLADRGGSQGWGQDVLNWCGHVQEGIRHCRSVKAMKFQNRQLSHHCTARPFSVSCSSKDPWPLSTSLSSASASVSSMAAGQWFWLAWRATVGWESGWGFEIPHRLILNT